VGEGVLTARNFAGSDAVKAGALDPEGFVQASEGMRCEGVPLSVIADNAGTPCFVYSAAVIRAQYARLSDAVKRVDARLHYSVKANSSIAVLALLRELGAGLDIVSGGELYRALHAGYNGRDIVFSGVGKTEREIEEALRAQVLLFNVESEQELHVIQGVAKRLDVVAPVALRVNPEVLVDTPHPYTRTGEKGMKFGIPFDEALAVAKVASSLSNCTSAPRYRSSLRTRSVCSACFICGARLSERRGFASSIWTSAAASR
jgi:diaminopimelate decarboxylase